MYFYVKYIPKREILCASSLELMTCNIHNSHLPCICARSMCKVISSIKLSFGCYKLTNVAWTVDTLKSACIWYVVASYSNLFKTCNPSNNMSIAMPVALNACLFRLCKKCEIYKSFVLCTISFFISYVSKSN